MDFRDYVGAYPQLSEYGWPKNAGHYKWQKINMLEVWRETGQVFSSCPEKKAPRVVASTNQNPPLVASVKSALPVIGTTATGTGVVKPTVGPLV